MKDRKDLKALIYQVAAATDRGQRMNAMIAPMYRNKLEEMKKLVEDLQPLSDEITQSSIEGEWAVSYTHLTLPTKRIV